MSPARTTASTAVARNSGSVRGAWPPASRGVKRFTIRTSMPPPFARAICTSSMKLRMKKMPRPLDFRRFSGASGSGSSSGSKPSPWSRTRIDELAGGAGGDHREFDGHQLGRVAPVAVLDGVDDRFADRHADPMLRILVEAEVPSELVADRLDQIDHLEQARELQANGVASIRASGGGPPRKQNGPHKVTQPVEHGPAGSRPDSDAIVRRWSSARPFRSGLPPNSGDGCAYPATNRSPTATPSWRRSPTAARSFETSRRGPTARRPGPASARSGCRSRADTATLTIIGRGPRGFCSPAGALDARNSGTTTRLLTGLLAAHPFAATITGDDSLRRRPMRRVIAPLTSHGCPDRVGRRAAPDDHSRGTPPRDGSPHRRSRAPR